MVITKFLCVPQDLDILRFGNTIYQKTQQMQMQLRWEVMTRILFPKKTHRKQGVRLETLEKLKLESYRRKILSFFQSSSWSLLLKLPSPKNLEEHSVLKIGQTYQKHGWSTTHHPKVMNLSFSACPQVHKSTHRPDWPGDLCMLVLVLNLYCQPKEVITYI